LLRYAGPGHRLHRCVAGLCQRTHTRFIRPAGRRPVFCSSPLCRFSGRRTQNVYRTRSALFWLAFQLWLQVPPPCLPLRLFPPASPTSLLPAAYSATTLSAFAAGGGSADPTFAGLSDSSAPVAGPPPLSLFFYCCCLAATSSFPSTRHPFLAGFWQHQGAIIVVNAPSPSSTSSLNINAHH